jgi:transposase
MAREYIGIDLHKQFFQACAVQPTGERLWEGRYPRTDGGLSLFAARCDAGTAVAVEATGPTWAFVDRLQPTGATVCVVDPRKTKLKAGVAAKTDRLDARRLADALRRESVVSIYVPPPAVRELREICRGRHQVVRVRTRVSQMIRALLLRSGGSDVPVRRVFSPRGLAWLEQVPLPPAASAALQRLRRLLTAIQAEAVDAEQRVTAAAAADPIAPALDALVGIGPVLALTMRAEIGDIARFRRGAELASYAGLVPRVDASAARYRTGRITKEGSPWLRWALVEAAMHAIRRPDAVGRNRGPGSSPSGQAVTRRASRWRAGCVTTAWPCGHRARDVLSTSGAPA